MKISQEPNYWLLINYSTKLFNLLNKQICNDLEKIINKQKKLKNQQKNVLNKKFES